MKNIIHKFLLTLLMVNVFIFCLAKPVYANNALPIIGDAFKWLGGAVLDVVSVPIRAVGALTAGACTILADVTGTGQMVDPLCNRVGCLTFNTCQPPTPPVCNDWTYTLTPGGVCSYSNSSHTYEAPAIASNPKPDGCAGGTPGTFYVCTPACTDWNYSSWGNCSNQLQTRTATGKLPIAGCAGSPNASLLNRACVGASIKSDVAHVVYNGRANISWTSSLATSCTTTKQVDGFSPIIFSTATTNNGLSSGYLSKSTNFILNCMDANNNRASESVGINVDDRGNGKKSCTNAEDCQFVWSPDYTCELISTSDGSGDYTLHCYDPLNPTSPNNPGDIVVKKSTMPTCTFSQDYINKNTVLKMQPFNGTNISSDIRWLGSDKVSTITSGLETNKIYTTVGVKTISAVARIKSNTGDAYVSACVSTTTMKLSTSTNTEI